jgi:outer membrane protein TolC
MRSPIGPILIILGLATTAILVLLLIQTTGLRGDVESARADVAQLRTQVETAESGLTASELEASLADLESRLETLVDGTEPATGAGDPSQPAGGSVSDELAERLDEILASIAALDRRVDEICGNVPVC